MDAIAIASHVTVKKSQIFAVDIGCGCGIISLLLSKKHPELIITGIEIQKELAELAKKNSEQNKLSDQIKIICEDINNVTVNDIGRSADIIVANPPFKKKDSGRLNPDRQKAIARHEIYLSMNQLFKCASRLLAPDGNLYFIYPVDRIEDINHAMEQHGFFFKFTRLVHTQKDMPPKRIIVCAVKNDTTPCNTLPPLYLPNKKT